MEDPGFYLCNPDMKPISALAARNRALTLRFNDLSSLDFEVPKYGANANGVKIELPYYDQLEARRLVEVDNIGWFQITQVQESESGVDAYKKIKAESHQASFKEKGFTVEERLYKFYDAIDPLDEHYDMGDKSAIPSILGQLYQQLGIKINLSDTDYNPTSDFKEWTVIYIDPSLKYVDKGSENMCRLFAKKAATYGYDFMVNDVEKAFEVIFDFDFMNHAIKIKRVEQITEKTNIYLSFDNVINNLQVYEKADDIVTVLSCNGDNLDIRAVNPTGTNYIVDFSYYMDEKNNHWMSKELITKLKNWKQLVESKRDDYTELVKSLRNAYVANTKLVSDMSYLSLKNQDLETVRDQFITDKLKGDEIFTAETCDVDGRSLDTNSPYNQNDFNDSGTHICYPQPPTFINGKFVFSGDGVKDTLASNITKGNYYFCDYAGDTYCKLVPKAEMNTEVIHVGGLKRYTIVDKISAWLTIYAQAISNLTKKIETSEASINTINEEMRKISKNLNLLSYFVDSPSLLKELKCYWVEGDYENTNLAVLEDTTQEEAIDLAKELLSCGEKELAKVSQPRFSITIEAMNFLNLYEFRRFSSELALGKVITIEKNEHTHFYPALTSMSFNLDEKESFELQFSNSLKLNDWGFTFADMITSAASTSRTVAANWSELTSYSKNKDSIKDLLLNPLDRTLRTAETNMVNQEFIVDTTGILGRKRKDMDIFEDEQIRIINNVILFTNDAWKTAKTALGKIVYNHQGEEKQAYGLLAEVLVGGLILGDKLHVTNDNNNITLDGGGITISKPDNSDVVFKATSNGDIILNNLSNTIKLSSDGLTIKRQSDSEDMFVATTDGNVILKGTVFANAGKIGGYTIEENVLRNGKVGMSSNNDIAGSISFWSGNENAQFAPFQVTNEGKLIASDANITGVINAESGKIGGLIFDNNGISSGKNGLTFTSDGLIIANQLEINDYFQAKHLQVGKVSGRGAGTASLNFESGTKEVRNMTASVAWDITDKGSTGAWGIGWKEGNVNITVRTNEPMLYSKTLVVKVTYRKTDGVIHVKTVDIPITIKKGANYATARVGYYLNVTDGTPLENGLHPFETMGAYAPTVSPSAWTDETGATIDSISCKGSFLPEENGKFDLGSIDKQWNTAYLTKAAEVLSDINFKKNVIPISDAYSEVFDRLQPVTYMMKNEDNKLRHMGLIAQDFKSAIIDSGLLTKDVAAFCEKERSDGSVQCGIRYSELIALLIYEVQKLKRQLNIFKTINYGGHSTE